MKRVNKVIFLTMANYTINHNKKNQNKVKQYKHQ